MAGACAGLRVLDLSTGHGGALATMILADYGAEVIRVEPETGEIEIDPAYLLLNRGKKSIGLDLQSAAGQRELRRLAAASDVLLETRRPGEMEAAGLDYKAISEINPSLVYCSITGFGPTGPLAQVKADDALVMAKAGIFRAQRGWEDGERPFFRSCRDASTFSAMLAVQGVLGALRVRDLTGKGQRVETSMLQALACRQNPNVRFILREGEGLPSEARGPVGAAEIKSEKNILPHHMDARVVNLIGARMETKDGRWLVHSHTEPHFFPAWIKAIGFDWIWEDERFKAAPYQFPTPEDKAELIRLVQARIKERTSAEWIEAYLINGNVCGDLIQTTQESLRHPQSIESGIIAEVDDPRVGRITAIGPLVKLSGADGEIQGPAPEPRQHTAEILKSDLTPRAAIQPAKPAKVSRPLEGVTIVEAAYYYATPFATALLGELGARIIKIEPLRGDPYRNLGRVGKDPVLNLGQNNMVRAMSGKESITLNLKDPKGVAILHALVKKADMFIHNFRKGVPETLGMDEDTLRKVNPKLIYQYGASYGKVGPYARQPAIDPIIAAYAGSTAHQAGKGNKPLTETGADPTAAAGCSAAMMLALYAAHRTGKGQYAESAMIVSNIYLNYEDALSYEGKPARREVDHRQLGLGATYRLYKTAQAADPSSIPAYCNPDPRWVFLAADSDDEFAAFCKAAGREDLARDARFATRKAREGNDAALIGELEALFLTRSASEWEAALLAAGVGCVMADEMSNFAFLYRHPQAKAVGLVSKTEHPVIGAGYGSEYWRFAPMLRFSDTPARGGPFCEYDEHTTAILKELGYDDAAIAQLQREGVVASQEDHNKLAVSKFGSA
jgi:crotonobetainyl-CoA:carnitine CoA-transferase CaiB-like acyl-CoA transferase